MWELTLFRISLLKGFMISEETNPLRYITKGIVAMYFCTQREEKHTHTRVYFMNNTIQISYGEPHVCVCVCVTFGSSSVLVRYMDM